MSVSNIALYQMFTIIYLSLWSICHSHMSLQYPNTRHVDVYGNEYATWLSNEPMIPARPHICHGLPSESTIQTANQFTVGEVITVDIYGSASHYGGHCSFWVSIDDITFTKIADVKDCTLNPTTTQVILPDTLPIECGTKCTFAWTWIPTVSAVCEIYSNCADISVSGLEGKIESNPQTVDFSELINAPDYNLCQRVDETSHWSELFKPLKLQETPEPSTTSSTSTSTTQSTTSTSTSTTSTSSSNNPDSIKIQNYGTLGEWWYAMTIDNIQSGYEIELAQVGSNDNWIDCVEDTSSGQMVYGCQNTGTGFQLPLDIRLTANGETIQVDSIITEYTDKAVFDFGANFDDTGKPSTTKSTSTSTTSTSTTSSTTSTTSTTNGNFIGIKMENNGDVSQWHYSAIVTDLADGYTIEVLEVGSNGEYNYCTDAGYFNQLVYNCNAPSQGFIYPLDVRILATNGEIINKLNIVSDTKSEPQDIGINFGSGKVSTTTTTTTSTSTPAPTTTTTSSSTSTSTTTLAPPTTSSTTTSTTATSTSTSTTSTSSSSPPDNGVNKEIIAYYPAWQWYDRSKKAQPKNLDFTKVTIVNFAFFQPDVEGNLYGTDDWADPNVLYGPRDWSTSDETANNYKCHLQAPNDKVCANYKIEEGLIGLAQAAGAKIFPSIGGWTLSDNFPTVAASATTRSNFAKQCVELIKMYDFDGIDITIERRLQSHKKLREFS